MRPIRAIAAWFLDASTLLAVAALLIVAGLAGGYIDVQQRAERELALRQGPPVAVPVEAYDQSRDMGPAREVAVRATIREDKPLLFTLPRSGDMAAIIPLFAAEGPRDAAAGMILIPVADPAALPEISGLIGAAVPGQTVREIEIGGFGARHGDFELMLAGALSVQGLQLADRPVVVRPFLGSREAALALPAQSSGWWLWCLSAASMFVALAGYRGLWAAPRALARERLYEQERAQARGRAHRPVSSTHFQPLPSQDEVNEISVGGDAVPRRLFGLVGALVGVAVRACQTVAGVVLRPLIDRIAELRSSR